MKRNRIIALLAIVILIVGGVIATSFAAVTDSSFIAAPEKTLVKGVDYEYSFAVLGDTQCISVADAKNGTAYTKQIFDWIKNNEEDKNIQYVLGLGDITDTFKSSGAYYDAEWALAKDCYAILEDAGIPYSLVRGNHDISSGMNAAFGKGTRYYDSVIALSQTTDSEGRPMGGFEAIYTDDTHSAYKIENSYRKITVGEDKWIIVTLDWAPAESTLTWLTGILEANPDYRAIITLHQFVQKDGAIIDDAEGTLPHENIGDANWGEVATGGTVHPRALWDTVLRKYANVEMILSGHVPVDDIVRTQYRGDNGNTVTCMLIDPQEMDEVLSAPVGMIAMFYFSADGSVVHVEYISAVRDLDGNSSTNAYRGASNQFSMQLEYTDGWVKTEYGYAPKTDYDSATFLTFLDDDGDATTESVYLGSYERWVDDAGTGGILPMARTQYTLGGAAIRQKKTLSVLMLKNYDGTSDGKYQNIGDVCGTLRLDLNGNIFKNGKYPMLAAYTRTSYTTNTFEVKNGSVTLSGSAGIIALQTASNGNGGAITVKLSNLNVSYGAGGTATAPIVTTYPGTNGKNSCGAVILTDCNIDAYTNAPSAVTLFNLADSYANNDTTVTVCGGSITVTGATSVSKTDDGDKIVFTSSEKGSTSLKLPITATATPSEIYEDENGERVAFYESSRNGEFITYAPEAYKIPAGSLGTIDVWLIAGQSNAAGYAIDVPTDAHTDSRFNDGFTDVLYYGMADDNVVSAFTPVKIGQGKSVTASGAELGIASALGGNGNMNAVIKLGRGSSYLYPDTSNTVSQNYGTWTSPSYIEDKGISTQGNMIGQLYVEFIKTVTDGIALLEASGYTPVIRGIWWMQGEAETWREALANEYETLLTAFISDVRSDLSEISGDDLSNMPFVIGVAGVNKTVNASGEYVYDQPAYAEAIAQAQRNVSGKVYHTACIETAELTRRDQWHFTADGQKYLGEQFVSSVVALEGKYSVTVNGTAVTLAGGGAYEAGETVKVTVTVADGFVIDKITCVVGNGEPAEITLAEDGSYTFTMPEANVAFTVETHDPGMIDTAYGTIPSLYADVNAYPFAVFRNGEFYNAYATWNDVLRAGASVLTAENTSATLLLRRDYSTDEDTASIQDLYTYEGNLTIDLGDHTLTRGKYHLFQIMAKKQSTKARPTNIKIVNGTICTKGSTPFVINTNSNAATLDDHFYFEMDGVTFKYASGATVANMIMVTYTNGTANTEVTAIFKNCIFELTDAPACTLFNLAEESGSEKIAHITVEESTFVSRTLAGISLYAASGNDGFILGDGIEFRLPAEYDVTDAVYTDTSGKAYSLTKTGMSGSDTVYGLAEVDLNAVTTPYGTIPSEYTSATTYPFVVFDQDGKFFAAYEKWDAFLAAGSKILTSANTKATLLVRRNYNTSENGSSSQNWYTFSGSILIDLGGNTLTIGAKSHLFQFINKCTKNTTTEITMINGAIVTYKNYTPFIINGHANSKANYTVDLTCNRVSFVYHKSSTVKKLILDTFASGTTESNFIAEFNDCVFDISASTATVVLFNAKESSGTVKKAEITVNGGTLKSSSFACINFANLGTSDSLVFGKNASGNYLTLVLPEGQTADTTASYNGADGEKLSFTATGVEGEYVLSKPHTHSYTAIVTTPTCTENGYTTYTCTCGDSYVSDETAALGHTYDNETDADCNNCGEIREITATEGEVSKKISWSFADGVLTVTGRGKIKNFSANTAPWCHLADQITKVVISEGITYIGNSAFFGFTAIDTVNLPNSLTAIGRYTFYGCTNLKNITIPEAVTEIGAYAFRRSGLETIDFAIGYGWSAGEKSFNVTEITAGGHRFISKSYYKLDWVRNTDAEAETLPSNYVTGGIMHTDVIWTLTTLENGKLKLTITGNGMMADYGTACTPWYSYAADIVEIEVCEGVTTIGRCAFYGLKFVRKVTLPETLTAIGDYGFYMCRLLKTIELPEGVTAIGKDAFTKTGVTV